MKKSVLSKLLILLIAVVIVAEIVNLLQPALAIRPNYSQIKVPTTTPASLPWPNYGQAAIGAINYGVLASNGDQKPMPIASVAKVITALAVLQQKPLTLGQQGPTITLGPADVGFYNNYVSQDGSVVPVVAGEQITEYQALEAMLLPSANNMADSLAVWAFNSMDDYVVYANNLVDNLGLNNTTVNDASGFSPDTTASATDLVKLGLSALNQPVLAQIASQPQAEVPIAGTVGPVKNTNWLLGSEGIIGIKTGNTDQAGGCYLFATQQTVGDQKVTIIGAIEGAPDLNAAIASGKALAQASANGFSQVMIAKAGQIVGTYRSKWGVTVNATAKTDLNLVIWKGQKISHQASLKSLKPGATAGTNVGTLTASSGAKGQNAQVQVVTTSSLSKPSLAWRLRHF